MTNHGVGKSKVPFPGAKALIARLLTCNAIGRLIGWVYGDRIPFHGMRVDVSADVSPSIKASIFWEIYESAEIRFVEKYLAPGLDVVELGSSLGIVSIAVARKEPKRMLCVEANTALVNTIRRNLSAHAPMMDVTIINRAIDYSSNETVEFTIGESNLVSSLARTGHRTISVSTVTLAGLLSSNGISDYVLVMDIEGAEAGIITRDLASLNACRMIIAELHESMNKGPKMNVDDLARSIVLSGFSIIDRRGSVFVFRRNGLEEKGLA